MNHGSRTRDARPFKLWAVVYGTAAGNFFTYFHQKSLCMGLREWLACACKEAVYGQYILSAEKKPVDKCISLPLRLCLLIILGSMGEELPLNSYKLSPWNVDISLTLMVRDC